MARRARRAARRVMTPSRQSRRRPGKAASGQPTYEGASDDDECGSEHDKGASEHDKGRGGQAARVYTDGSKEQPTGRASNLRGASEHETDDECEGSEAAWKQAVHRGVPRIPPYSVCRAIFASCLSSAWFIAQKVRPQALSGSQQHEAPCAG